jgi:alkylation response protein AidB-like acyl-CoA dehydrogenase
MGLTPAETWRYRVLAPCIDSTVTLERARLEAGAPALWVAAAGTALPRRALLLDSAYLVGMAEAACSDSVDYAKVRQQFGQPIGAFQAVKHRCAEMLARASAAWNLTVFAALSALEGAPDAQFQAIAAKLMASDTAFRNAAVNIQNHGGIGFTGEYHAHLYVKRAHLFDRLGGDMAVQKKRFLAQPPVFQNPVLRGNAANLA